MGTNVRSTKSLVMADALCQACCGRAGAQTCLQLNLEQTFLTETDAARDCKGGMENI